MKYIVLDIEQKDGLDNLRAAFMVAYPNGFKRWSNYQPIEIETKDANGDPYFILPLSVLSDPDLKEFNDFVMANKTTDLIVREVLQTEFKADI